MTLQGEIVNELLIVAKGSNAIDPNFSDLVILSRKTATVSYFCFCSLISLNNHDRAQGISPKVCSFSSLPTIVLVLPARESQKMTQLALTKVALISFC